ncbi:unnamed protein product [Bemisia tabaci]|uniref:Brix domain-containing protein n=1 Tax=Bemisia tabaci TaxID=7038 RepID=A0A9P0A825_BEMTA|nr:unnamed protein product [Bemisia tabaci]
MTGVKAIKRRRDVHKKVSEKKKARSEARKIRKETGDPGQTPKTIENQRKKSETILEPETAEQDRIEEVERDIATDEFSSYFNKEYEPKILLTSCTKDIKKKTRKFMIELSRVIPNTTIYKRRDDKLKKIIPHAIDDGYSDIVVINENSQKPNGLLLIHLPDGPTANFRLSNVRTTKEMRKDHKLITEHRPEVILNNFTTRLGHSVARMLASIFHYDPEFKGRRVVTFHNQRDFIFFRHHIYWFKSGERCALRELGPRFTLKLQSLQMGTFDTKFGDYEWTMVEKRKEIEKNRRQFVL